MEVSEVDQKEQKPEIFIGLVGAVGTNLNYVSNTLENSLAKVGYGSKPIELSSHLKRWIKGNENLPQVPEYDRINEYQNAGDKLREISQCGSALAVLAMTDIQLHRFNKTDSYVKPVPSCAYILKSLKHPDEVKKLHEIYGHNFLLLAAYCPQELRAENLGRKIAKEYGDFEKTPLKYKAMVEPLMLRDEFDSSNKWGQNVSDTFPLADVFVDASDKGLLEKALTDFFELLFGNTFITPKSGEYAMFHAYASSLRSASLSRRVGAVIITKEGDIIAIGTNEVPKAGGGLCGSEDVPDNRDHAKLCDMNDKKKRELLEDIFERLKKRNWLVTGKSEMSKKELVREALHDDEIKNALLMDLIEFGRPVHAEMAALIDAARRTISINGCTLYTTTFPCHDCAKHIVAAGITKVVYVSPYRKSQAQSLFSDLIAIDRLETIGNRVSFEPFVGIAPRRYMELFSIEDLEEVYPKGRRKNEEGDVIPWDRSNARPRFVREYAFYETNENKEFKSLVKNLSEKGLITDLVKEQLLKPIQSD